MISIVKIVSQVVFDKLMISKATVKAMKDNIDIKNIKKAQ